MNGCRADIVIFRALCIEHARLDITGISETHLKGSEQISVPGFKYFGQNRPQTHVQAKCGSGGVGCLV